MKNLSRKKAREKLEDLKKQTKELEDSLNSPASLFEEIEEVSDIYAELGLEEPTLADVDFLPKEMRERQLAFIHMQHIEKLFNGTWIPNWRDTREQKWYPYFRDTGSGVVFYISCYDSSYDFGSVAYFKDKATADFVGTKFLHLFKILAKAK